MSDNSNKETLQNDCKGVSLHRLHPPGRGGRVVEWEGNDLIPLTPVYEEPQPKRTPTTIYIPSIGPRTKQRLELLVTAILTLGGMGVGFYYGALTLIAVFEIILSKDFVKAALAVTAVLLIYLMMYVKLTSRRTGASYTSDDRSDPGWMPTRHGGRSRRGQKNTTIINVTGDSANITTSNNNNA